MTAHQPQLDEAARTLVQWARTRQSRWRDPSSDLMAALGNRYQALREPDPAPTPALAPIPPVLVTPATAAPPLAAAAPIAVAPAVARAAEPTARPSVAPLSRPEPARNNAAPSDLPLPPVGEPLRAAARAALRWIPHAAVAAAIILAAVAAPRLWKSYAPAVISTPKNGTISLDSTPPGSSVFIDGVDSGTTPLTKEIAAGTHSVEFRYKKGSRTIDVAVVGGQTAAGVVDWTRKPVGRLQVSSDTAATKVYVDGKMKGNAPLSLEGLSTGPHTVMLRSAQGSVKQTVTIREGETAQFAGSIYPGSLHVSAPFEIEISEGGQLLRLDDKNEVVLAPGPHKLRFVSASQGVNEERTVEVEPGKQASLTLSAPATPIPSSTAAEAGAPGIEAVAPTPEEPAAAPEPSGPESAPDPAR